MANYCWTTSRMRGSEDAVESAKALIGQYTTPHGDDLVTEFSEIVGVNLMKSWGWRHVGPYDDPSVIWSGELKWEPPSDFVYEMSLRFPECEFEMSFSIDYADDESERYFFQNGESRLVEECLGCYEFHGHETTPVHHWDIGLRCDDEDSERQVLAALEEEGFVVVERGRKMAGQKGEDIVAWIRDRFPNVAVSLKWSLPCTVNEDVYIEEVENDVQHFCPACHQLGNARLSPEVQTLLRVAERDIDLTADEVHWVIVSLLDGTFREDYEYTLFPRLQQLRHHVGREAFDARYLSGIRARLRESHTETFERLFASMPSAKAAELGYVRPYQPTKRELEIVLDHYAGHPELPGAESRVRAIEVALAAPKWTREWPRWDRITRERVQQAANEPTAREQVFDDDLFRELGEGISDPAPQRTAESDAVNWQEEGF